MKTCWPKDDDPFCRLFQRKKLSSLSGAEFLYPPPHVLILKSLCAEKPGSALMGDLLKYWVYKLSESGRRNHASAPKVTAYDLLPAQWHLSDKRRSRVPQFKCPRTQQSSYGKGWGHTHPQCLWVGVGESPCTR